LSSEARSARGGAFASVTPRRAVSITSAFKKDLKVARSHKKCDLAALRSVMERLERDVALEPKHRDHRLTGRYPDRKGGETDCRECHVGNDWLIYRFPDAASVQFIRTGTHSELFG
jgi:mRNA interferase YafQ